MASKKHGKLSWRQDLLSAAVLGSFVSGIAISGFLLLTSVIAVLKYPADWITWAYVAFVALLTWAPLDSFYPAAAQRYIRLCCTVSEDYFPTRLVVEEGSELSADKPYIIALEPHSALPVAVPAVFGVGSRMLPPQLEGRVHGLVSSVGPLVRQLYWWLGLRPITKPWIKRLVAGNRVPLLVPGGVQECLYMQPGQEVVFLKERRGFIRMAMQTGCAVIPVYAFGQNGTYHWLRPGPPLLSEATVAKVSRRMGMVPLLLLGRWGSLAPLRSPMLVVLGRPLEVPQHDNPPNELVQKYLDQFISEMQRLFEKYKAQASCPELQLKVL